MISWDVGGQLDRRSVVIPDTYPQTLRSCLLEYRAINMEANDNK
jgi:hypothetical protein